jgi:hypothetical protein
VVHAGHIVAHVAVVHVRVVHYCERYVCGKKEVCLWEEREMCEEACSLKQLATCSGITRRASAGGLGALAPRSTEGLLQASLEMR